MEENLYIALLYKQLSGELEKAEKARLQDWLAASAENRAIAKSVEQAWALGANYKTEVPVDLDADFALLQQRIAEDEAGAAVPLSTREISAGKIRPMFSKLRIAASILFLIAAGILLKQYLGNDQSWQNYVADTATKEAIQLADGSKVWVNTGSTFSYPERFDGSERRVKLRGEAFFDVAQDAEHPFIIETETGSVKVLGTSFNVRDFKEEDAMQVDVLSGKVRVAITGSDASVDLVKNQQAIYSRIDQTLVKQSSLGKNSAAWATRELYFSNNRFAEGIEQIERLYQVEVELENPALQNCSLTLSFKQLEIEALLDNIALAYHATLVNKGDKRFELRGGNCLDAPSYGK